MILRAQAESADRGFFRAGVTFPIVLQPEEYDAEC